MTSDTPAEFPNSDNKVADPVTSFVSAEEKGETPVGGVPNEYEQKTLPHVGELLPPTVFLVAVVELCERFTYYGCQGLFENYVDHASDGSDGRAGLGLNNQAATGLNLFYQFWCYVTPVLGGFVADQYLGKYKTIFCSCIIYMVGLLVLVCTSIPEALRKAGEPGYIVSIILTGIGTGGIKANVAPLIAEQYTRRTLEIKLNKKGERVIIDPYITITYIYLMFYWCINLGSLSVLATPYMERNIGFWSAYVLCLCMFVLGTVVLILGKKFYIDRQPESSVVSDAFSCIWQMIKRRNLDAPKLTWRAEHGISGSVKWDDGFVDEVKRALVACKVFLIYPIFWLCYNQFSSNFITQAGQMKLHGIPNDLMQNFDPIAIIVFTPLLNFFLYPFLRKHGINFKPISRIVFGFIVMSLAMMYAAIVQHEIYIRGPCYEHPLCEASKVNGQYTGNDIHVAIQAPAYMLIGVAEIFASATGYEYAYTKAPPRLKSFVQSLFLLTNAVAAAIGEAFTPVLVDPKILWMYVGFTVTSFVAGIVIWVVFGNLNAREEEMNYIEGDVQVDDNTDAEKVVGSSVTPEKE